MKWKYWELGKIAKLTKRRFGIRVICCEVSSRFVLYHCLNFFSVSNHTCYALKDTLDNTWFAFMVVWVLFERNSWLNWCLTTSLQLFYTRFWTRRSSVEEMTHARLLLFSKWTRPVLSLTKWYWLTCDISHQYYKFVTFQVKYLFIKSWLKFLMLLSSAQ